MLKRLHELADRREDFAFETTLSGKSYARWLPSLGAAGYNTELNYFWLKSADLAVARVALRVATGGHNIPEDTIRQRYARSVANFFDLYRPVVSSWAVYDNSQRDLPRPIAQGDQAGHLTVLDEAVWAEIQKGRRS
jgi:predicted ABC-type ATPase